MNEVVMKSLSIARQAIIEKVVAAKQERRAFMGGERTIPALIAENNLLLAEKEFLEVELAMVYVANHNLQEKIDFAKDPMGKK